MRVECQVDECIEEETQGVRHWDQPSVRVTCSRCGHETMSYGTDDNSVKRCLALMREECPFLESNFYVSDNYD